MARRWVDDEASRLVYDYHVIVVVNHVEWHILRFEVQSLDWRHYDAEQIAFRNLDGRFYTPFGRKPHSPFFYKFLRVGAAYPHEARKREIEPVAGKLSRYRELLKRRGSGRSALPLFARHVY